MGEKVEVFGAWFSPFSRRVELALKLKDIEYDYIEEEVYKKKSDLLLKFNPVYKKVPVFVHAGKPIAESIVILQYIEETWKDNPILPQHPYHKALALFWANFLNDKLLGAIMKARRRQGKEKEEAIAEACEALKVLEDELKGKRFFGGEKLGFVDIVANFVAYWIPAIEEGFGLGGALSSEMEKLPNLQRWCNEFVEHTIVKDTLPPKQDLLAFCISQFGNNVASK
ncbi:probable glutathione S-transferase [Benincasa hispida]|uniref:probable glutathione S-transferase n=1 Tax=Benincasa hispida TaxID=102211 RepID=UPI001901ECF8|nr:probable glutathione S-transferase [Benincasa hispida]